MSLGSQTELKMLTGRRLIPALDSLSDSCIGGLCKPRRKRAAAQCDGEGVCTFHEEAQEDSC